MSQWSYSQYKEYTDTVKLAITYLFNLNRVDKIRFTLAKNLYKMFLKSKIWLFHQFSISMKDISEKIEQFI